MKLIRMSLVFALMLLSITNLNAQSPCNAAVPSYTINLTGSPAGFWTSPNVSRSNTCCAATNPDQCIYFNLTLDPNSAGIQIDMIGADPAGSLFYDIGCTGSYPGGTIKCISGVGPHQITFCKPGGNKNVYKITSISKPLFPKDDTVRIGCKKQLITLGIVNNSVTWNAINSSSGNAPALLSQINTYLDSLNVASPTYSPASNAPNWVEYQVCGFPIASGCGFSLTVCDTVKVYNYPVLTSTIMPNPATFCNVGPGSGVTLTVTASGGLAPYTYEWSVSPSTVIVGSNSTYFATANGVYNIAVKDKLYNPGTCAAYYNSRTVSQGTVPIVNAGPSKKVCSTNPVAAISATAQYQTSLQWSGGLGTYSPSSTQPNITYSPTALEKSTGMVKLYLTAFGGTGCSNVKDSVMIYYPAPLNVSIGSSTLPCFNTTTNITATVSGGTSPYVYQWSTGSTSSVTTGGQGNYSLYMTDSLGCTLQSNYNLVAPNALVLTYNVSNVTVNGGNDGTASVTVNGGTAPYTVTWTPGSANTFSIGNLIYGVYTSNVTDANGCQIAGSTVVNEPRCLAFFASATSTNVTCYGNTDGMAVVTATGGAPTYTYSWNTSPVQTTSIATNLPAGVITCVVTDTNNCVQTANVVITEPSAITTVMSYTNVTILNGNNGSAAVNAFGGTTPYSYLWSNGPTTQSVTGLVAGTYSVTVTDDNGCSKSDNVKINQPPCNNLILNVVTNNVSCFGGNNGNAVAVVSGASTYTLTWSTSQTGPSISNLTAGNYSVLVSDGFCSNYVNFSITQPPQLSIGILPTNVSCYGYNNGSIDVTITGGIYPYSFTWNNGLASEDQVNLGPGTYSVLITDANGCQAIGSAIITQPQQLTVTPTVQNVNCIYGNNGGISLNVSGGTTPYTYTWSTGATTSSLSNIQAGGYTVTVKDLNGCSFSPSVIAISQPDSVKVSTYTIACPVPGSGQALATITPTGGTSGMFQVSFDNGITYLPFGNYSSLLNNNSTYTITLNDANNCTSLSSFTIFVKPEVKIDSVVYAKCYTVGTTTANAIVYPSGGDNGPYQISLDNGNTYQVAGNYTFVANVASTYSVYVRDTRGCVSAIKIFTLPSVLNATATVTSNYNGQNISCFGLTDGSATVAASGGTGVYSYTWSSVPSQTTANAINLAAGTFSVIVKDGNNCSITKTVTLTQPSAITATAGVSSNYNGQNISCFGYSDGSATVTASGATAPYTYQWNSIPNQTTTTASNLSAGVYSVIVKDVNNCAVTKTVSLTQPAAITATTSVTSNYNGQNISCFGLTDGSATVTTSGGTGAYTYTWNTVPAQNTAGATNLGAGVYSVIVNDANLCAVTKTVSLTQPTQIAATTSVTSNYNGQNISCFGLTDGSATVTTSGGTGAYTYTWNTVPAQNTSGATNLGAGIYSVTVRDANLCAITKTVSLTQPAAITSTAGVSSNYNGQNISCFGLTDGSATVAASGGTGAYSYTWTSVPSQTTSSANNLGAGTYSIIVTDVNNCLVTKTVTLTQPSAITATAGVSSNYNGQNISCFGYSDGSATVTASGATAPYTYQWNSIPNQTTTTASNLSAGVYSVIVKDINNCAVTKTVSLSQPAGMSSTVNVVSNYNGQNISCFGASDGSAAVTVTNGTSPYTYTWSTTPVQTTTLAGNLSAGNYTIAIADANGCMITNTITLNQPSVLTSTTSVTSNYNGQDISCFGLSDGSASVTVAGSTAPYTYTWTTVPSQTNAAANGLSAGTYSVVINDINGCTLMDSISLTQPPALNAVLTSTSNYNGYNVSCFSYTNGSIDISLSGGTGAYTYSWSNTATAQDINNIGAGNYSVVATDANGCTDTLNITMTQPAQLVVTIDSLSNFNGYNISCFGSTNGTVFVSVTGGVTNYNYQWSNGSTNEDLTGVGIGNYYLSVTDLNNCNLGIDTVLIQPPALTNTYSVAQPLCNGVSNGSINVSVNGGVSPFTYN